MITKTLRLVRHQWWIIAVVALIGAAGALYANGARNDRIEPEFSATGQVLLASGNRNAVEAAAANEEAFALAESSNADEIASGGVLIELDDRRDLLIFTVTESSESAALATAERVRNNYIEAEANLVRSERAARLAEIVDDANDVLNEIELLSTANEAPAPVEVPDEIANEFGCSLH